MSGEIEGASMNGFSSWRTVRLSDVAAVNPENLEGATSGDFKFQYIDISSVERGRILWRDVQVVQFRGSPSRARRVVRPRDVLLSTVRPALQAHAFADWREPDGFVCSTGFAVLRADEQLESRFLRHLVFSSAISEQLRQREIGSSYPAVTERDVRNLLVSLPPLAEQRRIADVLDTAVEAIRKTEALIAKLKQLKQGLLHDLLTRGLAESGKMRDPVTGPEQFRDSVLGRMPREWQVRRLDDLADISSGVTLGRGNIGMSVVELPYLRVANVQDGYLDLTDVKTVIVRRNEVERFALRRGDVLMNEGGDFDKLGRGTVWEGQISPCLHQNHVFRVRPFKGLLDPYFLAAFSGSAAGKKYFVLSSKQSTNLASINSTQLKAYPVPCPSLAEQKRIAVAIRAHDAHIRTEEAYLDKLQRLKKGLMQDLLTGRVRVPVPESELLEAGV